MTRWVWALAALVAGFGIQAVAQTAPDDLTKKQLIMLQAEAQFFSALAQQQKDEIDKLKTVAANPCGEAKP